MPEVFTSQIDIKPGDFNLKPSQSKYEPAAAFSAVNGKDTECRDLEFQDLVPSTPEGWADDFFGNEVVTGKRARVFRTPIISSGKVPNISSEKVIRFGARGFLMMVSHLAQLKLNSV